MKTWMMGSKSITSRRALAVVAGAMVLAGCGASEGMHTRYILGGNPYIAGYDRDRARVAVVMVNQSNGAERTIQQLPTAYDAALLTLTNSSNLLTAPATKSIALAAPGSQSSGIFSALRPGSGYGLGVELRHSGTAVAEGSAANISLAAGELKVVTIVMGVLNQLEITTSGNNTVGNATDWLITKGDTVTFKTGFAANEGTVTNSPVQKMQIVLGSGLYTDGSNGRVIAEKTDGYDHFVWNTGAQTATFDPNHLTGSGTQRSSLKFRLLDSKGNLVGETTLSPVSVIDGAVIDLKLQ